MASFSVDSTNEFVVRITVPCQDEPGRECAADKPIIGWLADEDGISAVFLFDGKPVTAPPGDGRFAIVRRQA